jgi:hypothetical protein
VSGGAFIVGIGARGGLLVDEFSVACQKIPVTGEPGQRGGFKSIGPGGGTFSASGICGKGDAIHIIWMKSGSFIDKVKDAWCFGRDGNGWEINPPNFSKADVDIGGVGGVSCSIRCPDGEALYKVTVKYGGVIDSIRGECRQ